MGALKTLFDLSSCLDKGRADLHQDSCQIFSALSGNTQVQLDGLLYADEGNLLTRTPLAKTRAEKIEQAHYFFQELFNHDKFYLTRLLTRLNLKRFFTFTKKQYDLYPIDRIYDEVIWRNVLSRNLNSDWQQATLANQYYFSEMTKQTLSSLNTENYDFVIFPEVSAIKVTGKAKKIIRFRNPIAITEPDFSTRALTQQYAHALKQASLDAYFVCDSEPSRNKLIEFFPVMEERSCVIPSAICIDYAKTNDKSKVSHILAARAAAGRLKKTDYLYKLLDPSQDYEYILHVGTTDPEKNLVSLVQAWEKLNFQHKRNIKLVIVGNSDSVSKDLEITMQAHIEQGSLIYLSKVTDVELSFLYSHARLFVSPAYADNTSTHLFSAMHYGCPTVVSDIPVYRWVMADAAWYCDPYSIGSLADSMARLLYAEHADSLRDSLVTKGLQRVKMFSHDKLAKQWISLFDKIKVASSG